jgi:uncharacterized membrane protein YdfJ with MMPL/SSD domain
MAVFAEIGSLAVRFRWLALGTFLVRALLVPSTVVLLGRWHWWPSHMSNISASRPPSKPGRDQLPSRIRPAGELSYARWTATDLRPQRAGALGDF